MILTLGGTAYVVRLSIVKSIVCVPRVQTPGWGCMDLIVKIHQMFWKFLLCSWTFGKQTRCTVILSVEASTKTVQLIAPGSGFQAAGREISENAGFSQAFKTHDPWNYVAKKLEIHLHSLNIWLVLCAKVSVDETVCSDPELMPFSQGHWWYKKLSGPF